MTELPQYSLVCKAPGSEPHVVLAYTGNDISKIVGISQAERMPPGTYGWIQEAGDAEVSVVGGTRPAYVDFRPNQARMEKTNGSKGSETASPDEPHLERLRQLPPLMMETGDYCKLIREARDVFVDGHSYACVAMCGIAIERFQFDKAMPFRAKAKDKMWKIQKLLTKYKVLTPESMKFCKEMATLRNKYAHGQGTDPSTDALRALYLMHEFIRLETDLMRDYYVIDGRLHRR